MTKDAKPWKNEEEFVNRTIELIRTLPQEHQAAFHNNSIVTVLYYRRCLGEEVLTEHIPSWGEINVAAATHILDHTWNRPFLMGISVYAALSRSKGTPPNSGLSVEFEEVWEESQRRMDRTSPESRSFLASLSELGPVERVVETLASSIMEELIQLPVVHEHQSLFLECIWKNILHGMATEASYVHLAARNIEFQAFLSDLLEHAYGLSLDPNNPHFEDCMRDIAAKAMEKCQHITPWPLDKVCHCGHDLTPFIFCCDPRNLIDIDYYLEKLYPDFVLHRDCCDGEFRGFICDHCGRVATWQKGVVESLGNKCH